MVHEEMDWQSARQHCQDLSGKLIEVRTTEQYNFVVSKYAEIDWFWLGGSNINAEQEWRWDSTGERVKRTRFWGNNQPNELSSACMHMWGSGIADIYCSKFLPFICTFD